MDLQDRAFAVGIFLVLGFCCIGAYVAVSGFMNANPQGIALGPSLNDSSTPSVPASATSQLAGAEIVQETLAPLPTLTVGTPPAPTNTPKGFKPTLTPLSRGTPSPSFLADIPTVTPGALPTSESIPTATSSAVDQANCGYPFCPRPGRPDKNLAPTNVDCPVDYLWGLVYDSNGQGIANIEVKYQQIGGVSDHTFTKGPPDTAVGRFDIVAGGGAWLIQIFQNGQTLSPAYRIMSRQPYTGGSSCPTRVDFVKQ